MRYILLIILLSGCGKGLAPTVQEKAPEFVPYAEAFIQEGLERGKDVRALVDGVRMLFGNPEEYGSSPEYIGVCFFHSLFTVRTIYIRQSDWEHYTDERFRKIIIFHELGHCALNLEHENNTESLMFPNLIFDKFLRTDWDTLVDELFQ